MVAKVPFYTLYMLKVINIGLIQSEDQTASILHFHVATGFLFILPLPRFGAPCSRAGLTSRTHRDAAHERTS